MNCPTTDKLSQYADTLLTEQELTDIHTHLKSCDDCAHVVEAFMKEQQFLKETLQSPTLPDDFTSVVLDKLDPYEQKANHKKRNPWKHMMLIAAGFVLAIGLSTTISPAFAQWIGGLFSTEQVDEGLRLASEAGLTKRINQEVTDQGITFKIEDVMTDSSRVALSYQILNAKGKPQNTYLDMPDSKNEMYAVDQDGKTLNAISVGWQDNSDYGLIEFSLREYEALKEITLMFDLVELNGVKGNWELEIPIDLKESTKLTTTLPLNGEETSWNGVIINLNEVQLAPSSNELFYETGFTKEERTKVEADINKLEDKLGKGAVNSFTSYGAAIQYHLENEDLKAIYHHNSFVEGQGHPSNSGGLQGSGHDTGQFGQMSWNDSFIPQKDESDLTFVLDGVFKTVPSDFSIKINPRELTRNPVSFEYEGNFITIKEAVKKSEYSVHKSLIPIEREKLFKIKMEGGKDGPTSSDLGSWALVDENGKVFLASQSGSILDEKDENGRYKTTIDLISNQIDEIPEELTLHLLSVTRYDEVKDTWKVPLYGK